MKSRVKHLLKSKFVRNVLIMATGTVAAQGVQLILSPIITRLYGPEAFGLMGSFMAMITIIAPVSALTYPIAVVLPKSDKEAKGLVYLSLYITLFLSILVSLILLMSSDNIISLFNMEKVSTFIFLIPFVILFSGILQICEQWLIRNKQFGVTAKVTFYQSLTINGTKAIMGLYYPLGSVLIVLSALGQALKAAMMFFYIKKPKKRSKRGHTYSVSKLFHLAKKYNDFLLLRTPQVLINATTQSLPVLLLTSFFGPVTAGYYTLSRSVMNIPVRLIGKSVGDVFYPQITTVSNQGKEITPIIKRAVILLSAIGIIPFGIIFLFGPLIFAFIFGGEWEVAGEYARWLAIWLFTIFIYQPCIRSFPVISAQGLHLKFTLIALGTNILSIFLGFYFFEDDQISVALFSISGALVNIILVFITLIVSKRYDLLR